MGGGLPREGVGAEKFGMSLETRETTLFWRDIPGFCRDIPDVPKKFEKISLCSILVPYNNLRVLNVFKAMLISPSCFLHLILLQFLLLVFVPLLIS